MEANGVIFSVMSRPAGAKTIYDIAAQIETAAGAQAVTFTTFDSAIGNQAAAFQGGQTRCSFRYNIVTKGQYTNTYLDAVALEGQLPADQPRKGAGGRGGYTQRDPVQEYERQKSIVKQSSFSTAFNFVASLYQGAGPEALEEAKGAAMALANELYGIAQPAAPKVEAQGTPVTAPAGTPVAVPVAVAAPVQAAPVAVPTTADEVAALVPGVVTGAQADLGAAALAWN